MEKKGKGIVLLTIGILIILSAWIIQPFMNENKNIQSGLLGGGFALALFSFVFLIKPPQKKNRL
ncbi:hypothetical protein [Rhizosphaericola mali]|uniref:Uncharacterized protein n=1 Tax=Rhizosphaericola mali TaxID=2545455 RepID=A0A5P2FV13_9BACT|nr:hypothetical protein [Rhizosphaericola mali]QES87316.1 hypothetical protein E0W69_001115 [Rhizosphaericola mali]